MILQFYRTNLPQLRINNTVTHCDFFIIIFESIFHCFPLFSLVLPQSLFIPPLSTFQVFEISNLAISVSVPALIFVLLVVRF